eukprot:TRINITY_DN12057_c0_g1_i2.p1 TRINITY_DN12057_c0_g1~~TRINITY_DN12057_c0_g1_i2.p1  ORF type:complete len:473 (+),score=61.03 TRINITY_DN12057_c0_g1_i2:61-1479(+)
MDIHDSDLDFTASCNELSWRSPIFSDWILRVGDQQYQVHRCMVALGDRGSPFFLAAFNEEYRSAGVTDLTSLLPEPCHAIFEQTLDFIYGSELLVTPNTVVFLRAAAHILQTKKMYDCCQDYLRRDLDTDCACTVLCSALRLDPDGREKSLVEASTDMLIHHLADCPPERLFCLPVELLTHILDSDALNAEEDFVFDLVDQYCKHAGLSPDQVPEIWDVIRYAYMSPRKLVEVAVQGVVPDTAWVQTCSAFALLRNQSVREFQNAVSKCEDPRKRRRVMPRWLTDRVSWYVCSSFTTSAEYIQIEKSIQVNKLQSRCGSAHGGMAVISDYVLASSKESSFAIRFHSRPMGCRTACGVTLRQPQESDAQISLNARIYFLEHSKFAWGLSLVDRILQHNNTVLMHSEHSFGENDVLRVVYNGPLGKLLFFKNDSMVAGCDDVSGDLYPAVQFCCGAFSFSSVSTDVNWAGDWEQ